MDITVNGIDLLRLTVSWPYQGAWLAQGSIEDEQLSKFPVGTQVKLKALRQTLVGHVAASGLDSAKYTYLVLTGGYRLWRHLPAKLFQGASERFVLGDTLASVGASLDASSAVLGQFVTSVRRSATAAETVAETARRLGLSWRVKDSGTVWVGPETWPAAVVPEDLEPTLTRREPAWGSASYVVEDPFLRPGQTYDGLKVKRLEWRSEGRTGTMRVWGES